MPILLSACSPSASELEGEKIACALDGASRFENVCVVERGRGQFIVRRPDGGFRRFEADGGEVRQADGADVVNVTPLSDGSVELSVQRDRYRLSLMAPAHDPQP